MLKNRWQIFISNSKKYFDFGYFAKIAAKVTLVTLAGFLTIYIIHFAIDKAFEKITNNIDELTQPNERLIIVNNLFRNITKLNNVLQEETASGRRILSDSYFEISDTLFTQLDSLEVLFKEDTLQLNRLYIIKENLEIQESILNDFLKVQYEYGANRNIESILTNIKKSPDKSIETEIEEEFFTEEEPDEEEKKGLFRRIFRKKEKPEDVELIVERQRVDSLKTEATYTKEKIEKIEKSITTFSHRTQHLSSLVQKKQLELLHTNNFLYQEVISIINEVEQEELAQQNAKTTDSFITAGKAIKHLNTVAAIFIGTSLILFILIIIDLSNSNKYRKQLVIATETEKNEAKAKQHFLSNMSHEIRTPLQSIYGYAEQAILSPDKPININAIYKSATHLLDVVNEVLDFSLISSGKINLSNELFSPSEQIKSVIDAMRPLCKNKIIDCILDDNLPKELNLQGDSFRLRQILFNMIGNAIKFTENGFIKLTTWYDNEELSIEIEDSGIGINKEQLDKLFQEYTQTDPTISNKYGGTGLGLSIVKKIIDIHNGDIEVESEVGKGTKFTVTIPYKKIENRANDNIQTKIENKFNQKVYIADDDKLILELFTTIFNKYNIPHKTYKNGIKLIKDYKKQRAPVIFLDMRMPKISGEEVCKELRKITPNKEELKIYALSAQTFSKECREELINNGYNNLISKPFSESEILEILNSSDTIMQKENNTVSALNLNSFLTLSNDLEEILELFDTIIEETTKDLSNFQKAINDNNIDKTTLILHKLAGRIGQIGEKELAAKLRDKEIETKNSEMITGNFDSLIEDVSIFVKNIETEKDKLFSN